MTVCRKRYYQIILVAESLQQQGGKTHRPSGPGEEEQAAPSSALACMGVREPELQPSQGKKSCSRTDLCGRTGCLLPLETRTDPASSRDLSQCPQFPARRGDAAAPMGQHPGWALQGCDKRTCPRGPEEICPSDLSFALCLYHYKCCKLLAFVIWSFLLLLRQDNSQRRLLLLL